MKHGITPSQLLFEPVKILSYVLNIQLLLINTRVQFLSFSIFFVNDPVDRSIRNAVMSSVYKHYVKHTEHRVNLSCYHLIHEVTVSLYGVKHALRDVNTSN